MTQRVFNVCADWKRTLENFEYGDKEMADIFLDKMKNTKFVGVSVRKLFYLNVR